VPDKTTLLSWGSTPKQKHEHRSGATPPCTGTIPPTTSAQRLALGAGYNDYALCAELKRAGVTPEIAGKEYVRGGVPTGMTVFYAVYTQQLTTADVAAMIERKRQREERETS
jgi:hypothetical protein